MGIVNPRSSENKRARENEGLRRCLSRLARLIRHSHEMQQPAQAKPLNPKRQS
jgi:hypothetical protein